MRRVFRDLRRVAATQFDLLQKFSDRAQSIVEQAASETAQRFGENWRLIQASRPDIQQYFSERVTRRSREILGVEWNYELFDQVMKRNFEVIDSRAAHYGSALPPGTQEWIQFLKGGFQKQVEIARLSLRLMVAPSPQAETALAERLSNSYRDLTAWSQQVMGQARLSQLAIQCPAAFAAASERLQ